MCNEISSDVKLVKGVFYFFIVVEVWIELDVVMISCFKVDVYWRFWIVLWKIYIKFEIFVGVWSV